MKTEFTRNGLTDLAWWVDNDHRVAAKVLKLVDEASRDPANGSGRPERLRTSDGRIVWSRRLNQKDRLVYEIDGDVLSVLSCRFHYGDH